MSIIIETERLHLRPFTMDDLPAFIQMRSKEEVSRFIGTIKTQTPEFVERCLRFYISCYERYGFGLSAVEEKREGKMIGWAGLHPLEDTGEIEIAYGFDSPYWGRGYATEIAAALLRYGFEHVSLERIVAVAAPENKKSWGVMEKLGMKFERMAKHYDMDCVFYALSRDEFKPRDQLFAVHKNNE